MNRKRRPSAASLDSQSSKTTACGGKHRSYDAGKQVKGRKRFILTARRPGDTQGLLLAVWVCAAGISEKAGAMQLLRYTKRINCLQKLCSRIQLVWVDGGYRGPDLLDYVTRLWGWTWQVVLRTDLQQGFQVLPRRWVVAAAARSEPSPGYSMLGGSAWTMRKKKKQSKYGLSSDVAPND